jgi:phosphoglycolate phosphatase
MGVRADIGGIAFDLDGTLVDSAPDIAHALNTALRCAGLACFELEQVRGWVGDGPDVLIDRALRARGHDDTPASLRADLRRGFDAATFAAPLQHGAVCDGVAALVDALRNVLPMVVVTNKPTPLARAVLAAAGLLDDMAGVFGADQAHLRKPGPQLLLGAARHLGILPARLLMVGDGAADLGAAQAAGCPAAHVAWGYGSHSLTEGTSAWRIATPEELFEKLCPA